MNWNRKKINFLGDSITQGVGASSSEFCYVNKTKEFLGLAVARNYGVSGTRIAAQKSPSSDPSWDQTFFSRAIEMDRDADGVVVFGGTNDFGSGDAPLGVFSDRTPETFYGALHTLMNQLIVLYPGKPIIVLTPLHRLREQDPQGDVNETGEYYKPFPTGPLCAYRQAIMEVASYYSLPVLDLWSVSAMQPNVPIVKETLMPDGLHPNDAGHLLIAQRLCGFLNCL